MAVMSQPIKQCRRHLFVTKDTRPFNEAEIGGNHDAGTFIQLAEKMEQQGTTCLAKGEIPAWSKNSCGYY
jgi:hypothetical protein